ncbi:FKBP-type peptidyl-prolyl cis-trans isomerase N-terminal domain-containing protein, partial [Burkholderia pseudomallei]|uniref:FKBP-type peptidyl-prolyl cis-trans isomerase N-terminal domain-containing protein n=1 Tax=Burkholderia pseudomallei TaxID=28450 RepID=UPI003CF7B02A
MTAVAPPPLSEPKQGRYVVGMMVADYARSVLQTLEKLDIQLDETLLSEGVRHTLTGTARLDEQTARAAMQRFQKNTDQRQAEKDRASRQMLSTLAGKQDTLEKKEDRVWVRLKKGGPAVSKQTPLSLSWEGRFYNGEVFETVTD